MFLQLHPSKKPFSGPLLEIIYRSLIKITHSSLLSYTDMLVLSIHVRNFVVAGIYLEVVPSYYILAKHYTCFKEYFNSPNLGWLLDNHIFLACNLLPPSCWVDENLHNHLIISFIMLSSKASGQTTLFIIHGNEFLSGIHWQAFLLSFVRLVNVTKHFTLSTL